MQRRRFVRLFVALTTVAAVVTVAGTSRAQSVDAAERGEGLLPLVTERVVRPGMEDGDVRYWWQSANRPQWTKTDQALRTAMEGAQGGLMRPSGDVRISRIYRTPDLSIDNAAALASVVGARRILVGEVEYRVAEASVLPGMKSVRADASLQIVDAASEEPSVIQTISIERTLYEKGSVDALLATARSRIGRGAGELLGRTLAASSGPVGIASSEEYLAFHDLKRGEALERIRAFLARLDTVEAVAVRWASEGLVALEVNPGERDSHDTVAYAARTLANHRFERMSVSRRQRAQGGDALEFSVEIAEGFGERRRKRQEGDRGGE